MVVSVSDSAVNCVDLAETERESMRLFPRRLSVCREWIELLLSWRHLFPIWQQFLSKIIDFIQFTRNDPINIREEKPLLGETPADFERK